ncbi:hypothetical protein DFS13_1222 [Burkholderia sp. 28_3]|nr:hypothetical protein DFS13_1222 [Burkholderia sp. 28_3]RAS41800.1 hypothetical protein DFS07_125116 [Burkholderia cenocepacia]
MKVHGRMGRPIAARPTLGGLERLAHECIKTVHFCGQVGRGHNCARPVRVGLIPDRSAPPGAASSARQQARQRPAACWRTCGAPSSGRPLQGRLRPPTSRTAMAEKKPPAPKCPAAFCCWSAARRTSSCGCVMPRAAAIVSHIIFAARAGASCTGIAAGSPAQTRRIARSSARRARSRGSRRRSRIQRSRGHVPRQVGSTRPTCRCLRCIRSSARMSSTDASVHGQHQRPDVAPAQAIQRKALGRKRARAAYEKDCKERGITRIRYT